MMRYRVVWSGQGRGITGSMRIRARNAGRAIHCVRLLLCRKGIFPNRIFTW